MAFWGMGFGRKRRRGWRRGGCWWLWDDFAQYPSGYSYGWGWQGRGYGWRWSMYNFWTNNTQYPWTPNQQANFIQQTDNKSIIKRVKDILNHAYTVEPFPGAPWLQIMAEGKIVGYLWEKVDIKSIDVGNPVRNGNYWSIPLMYKSRVVGYIYLY